MTKSLMVNDTDERKQIATSDTQLQVLGTVVVWAIYSFGLTKIYLNIGIFLIKFK